MSEWDAFFRSLAGSDRETAGLVEIVFALVLSSVLNFLVAGVYKRTYRGTDYSQDYVHTLIILGTVVTGVILVVHNKPAAAFGMFAAFSIIRFRRTVRQSRDIGFIFLAMAAGLGVGARQYQLAAITTLIICAVIYVISKGDVFAPARLSHYLRIRVANDLDYDVVFRGCFAEHLALHELIAVESNQAGAMIDLRYKVCFRDTGQPAAFVAALQQLNGNNRVILTSAASGSNMGE